MVFQIGYGILLPFPNIQTIKIHANKLPAVRFITVIAHFNRL